MTGSGARRYDVVRAPSHLGDVVMALPVMARLGADVVVERPLDALLALADLPGAVTGIDRGFRGFWSAVARIRREGHGHGLLLKPSFSAALLFRTAGVGRLRGTATDGRALLLADPVDPGPLKPHHRVLQYFLLAGLEPPEEPVPHPLSPPPVELAEWRDRLSFAGEGPLVGIFPGSNAPARRWGRGRFRDVARRLSEEGVGVVVFGGPGETALTAEVSRNLEGVLDAGGRTDLPGLAAALSLCDLFLTNDTGPMHLAGAVGTPTVTIWGSSSPHEVRPLGARDLRVRLDPPLPCMPCYRNECPRSGEGFRLQEAENECLRLISVEDVMESVDTLLSRKGGTEVGA